MHLNEVEKADSNLSDSNVRMRFNSVNWHQHICATRVLVINCQRIQLHACGSFVGAHMVGVCGASVVVLCVQYIRTHVTK